MVQPKSHFSENKLTYYTLGSIVLSGAIGLCLKYFVKEEWTQREISYIQFPGDIFINMVNSLIIPLIVSSIISATSTLQKSGSGKLGLMVLLYYFVTTTLGVILSVILVRTIRPGEHSNVKNNMLATVESKESAEVDSILDLARNMMSENIIEACLIQYKTILKKAPNETVPLEERVISFEYVDGTNILGLVFISLLIGVAIGISGKETQQLLIFVESVCSTMMSIMSSVITTAPIAIMFLIPAKILDMDDISATLSSLGILVITIFLALIIHAFIVLPLLYYINTGKSPYAIIKNLGPALITAFGTSSSTATIPKTIQCLDNLEIDQEVSRFMVPIGATINMDGLALYEGIGVIFLTQMRGLNLSLSATIITSVTATLSCIGASGLPSGGYMMLTAILNSLGIPPQDITYIIAIDFFVDRFRTTLNIIADALGSALVSHRISEQRVNS